MCMLVQADAGIKCPLCRQFVQGYETLAGCGFQPLVGVVASMYTEVMLRQCYSRCVYFVPYHSTY